MKTNQFLRYPFLSLIYDFWQYIRGSLIFILLLFVLNGSSTSFIFVYGRYGFYVITLLAFSHFILKWLTQKYKIGDHAFYLQHGIFVKTEETIPFDRIENVQKQTLLFHRLFKQTSLRFETAMTGDHETVEFNALPRDVATEMAAYTEAYKQKKTETESSKEGVEDEEETVIKSTQTIHFQPTKNDLMRASFTSLSFLILIPVVLSVFNKINDFFPIENYFQGWFQKVSGLWWVMTLMVILAVMISIAFGMARIFLKYGKYIISSDEEKIYIQQGTMSEVHFSIAKKNVQAVEITQTFFKRLLGLAEVKLVSAGKVETDDEVAVSSLYPFLPVTLAYQIIEDMLPDYHLETSNWSGLPRQVLFLRCLKHSWFFVIVAAGLIYFKPGLWGVTQAWWLGIASLFLFMVWTIYLNYKHSGIAIESDMFHFKQGSFTTVEFISKRQKVVEAKISQSFWQKKLALMSLTVTHRSSFLYRQTEMSDVSARLGQPFKAWYKNEST